MFYRVKFSDKIAENPNRNPFQLHRRQRDSYAFTMTCSTRTRHIAWPHWPTNEISGWRWIALNFSITRTIAYGKNIRSMASDLVYLSVFFFFYLESMHCCWGGKIYQFNKKIVNPSVASNIAAQIIFIWYIHKNISFKTQNMDKKWILCKS